MEPGALTLPSLDLGAIQQAVLDYDPAFDLLSVAFGEPEPAVTEPLDSGWYARIAGDRLVGVEIHGLVENQLVQPAWARTFEPMLDELAADGEATLSKNLHVAVSRATPATLSLVALLAGSALARFEAMLLSEVPTA